MEKIKFQFLLLVAMLMATSSAFASNGNLVISPADDAIVDSLKTFRLTFSDKKFVSMSLLGKKPMIYKEDGTIVGQIDCSFTITNNQQVTMTITDDVVKTPGIYVLQIPDSTFRFDDPITGEYSTAMTFHYRIPLRTATNPADGSVVQSINTIQIRFPQWGSSISLALFTENAATITCDATSESSVTKTKLIIDDGDMSLFNIYCTPTVTNPGKYTVTIPAYTFMIGGITGIYYDQPIILHYTISQSTGISDMKVEGNLKGIRINLNGQRVGDDYKGVVIENGVKRITK